MNSIAKYISYLLHPVFMPLLGVVLLFNSGSMIDYTPQIIKMKIYFVIVVVSIFLPLLLIALLEYYKVISNLLLNDRRERLIPLIITTMSYLLGLYMIKNLQMAFIIKQFFFAATLSLALVLMITVLWKISAHMTGIGGVLGLILGLMVRWELPLLPYLIVFILLSGILGSSRLRLNTHSPLQIYGGFILGMGIVFTLINGL